MQQTFKIDQNLNFEKFTLPTQKANLVGLNLFLVIEIKLCYLLVIGLNVTVIWGYLKFCWFMLDSDKYESYNLPHVTLTPVSLIAIIND